MLSSDQQAALDTFKTVDAQSINWDLIETNNFDDRHDASTVGHKVRAKFDSDQGSMCMKVEMILPLLDLDKTFRLISDVSERAKWDSRWESHKIIEQLDDHFVFFFTVPKPPVPMVSQREILTKTFVLQNGLGEGQHIMI